MALTLRMVGGQTMPEIARAFLVQETAMGQRITRAKAKINTALNADPSGVRTPITTSAAASSSLGGADSPTLTVFVRNAAAVDRWIATVLNGHIGEAQGYSGAPGVGCLASPIGTQLVVLSGSPGGVGTHPIGTIHIQPNNQATTVWLDFNAPGSFSFGPGIPDWWPDSGNPCP